MITVVCANPCLDRMVHLERLTRGGMNRVKASVSFGSGKGVNVAVTAAALGLPAVCIGLLPEENSAPVPLRLEEAGVRYEFIPVPGMLRCNMKLREADGTVTEVNESGAPVNAESMAKLADLCLRYAQNCEALVLAGSLPQRADAGFYAEMIDRVRASCSDCRVVVDAEGELLRKAVARGPFLIKPNRYELSLLCGHEVNGIEDAAREARALAEGGVANVIVTLGPDGAVGANREGVFAIDAYPCTVYSTVGAGDALLSAAAAALAAGRGMEAALLEGTAASTAVVGSADGTANLELAQRVMHTLKVRRL